jgi:hypothetical protein
MLNFVHEHSTLAGWLAAPALQPVSDNMVSNLLKQVALSRPPGLSFYLEAVAQRHIRLVADIGWATSMAVTVADAAQHQLFAAAVSAA